MTDQYVGVPSSLPVDVVERALPRPRARTIGVLFVALGGSTAVAVASAAPDTACTGTPWLGTPLGVFLGLLIVVIGASLIVEVPRASAVAPALALGAAMPLLGGALGGLAWVGTATCTESVLEAPSGWLVVQAGAALATVMVSWWLLYARDEFEPWSGAGGVLASTVAGLFVLIVGAGVILVATSQDAASVLDTWLSGPVPWAVAVALTGWLRRSPALAVVAGSVLQVVAVAFTALN